MALVVLDSVSHSYTPDSVALRRVSISIEAGERVGLVGPSGSGKSTLLRTINGLVKAQSGSITALGNSVPILGETGKMRLRREIGMIFQEFALIERLPVLTNVLVGRLGYSGVLPSVLGLFSREELARARQCLEEVGLGDLEDRLAKNLSGGQKQRLGIARALAQEPSLILGDEPTANLDVRTSDEILSLLVSVSDNRSATLLLSLHDVRAARRYCTRIIALRQGEIAWDGPAESFGESEVDRVFYA